MCLLNGEEERKEGERGGQGNPESKPSEEWPMLNGKGLREVSPNCQVKDPPESLKGSSGYLG